MKTTWMCLGSGAVSSLLMYFLDPERGRRRRHLLRDQLTRRAFRDPNEAASWLDEVLTPVERARVRVALAQKIQDGAA